MWGGVGLEGGVVDTTWVVLNFWCVFDFSNARVFHFFPHYFPFSAAAASGNCNFVYLSIALSCYCYSSCLLFCLLLLQFELLLQLSLLLLLCRVLICSLERIYFWLSFNCCPCRRRCCCSYCCWPLELAKTIFSNNTKLPCRLQSAYWQQECERGSFLVQTIMIIILFIYNFSLCCLV